MSNNFYYSVRLKLNHPAINPAEITESLGMESDYEQSKINYAGRINHYWNYTNFTTGEDDFFVFFEDILDWLVQEKKEFIDDFISTGGEFMIIIQLPGDLDSISLISKSIIKKTLYLGVTIGIEVFPILKRPVAN